MQRAFLQEYRAIWLGWINVHTLSQEHTAYSTDTELSIRGPHKGIRVALMWAASS